MRRNFGSLALAVLLGVAGIGLAPAPSGAATVAPARILIVGDSTTQGKIGDYTWRYWLWRTLEGEGKVVDFVGPHTGLYDPDTDTYDNPGYADPHFDQDHASWWGMLLSNIGARLNVHDAMTEYQPDIVINELGINDLVWVATPADLIDRMRDFVGEVRAVSPNATVVIGELTQTWWTNSSGEAVVADYNAMLPDLAASLDQPAARVIIAPRPDDYVQDVDSVGPAHPSPSGEVKIARQFSTVLDTLPLPTTPTPPPPAPPTYAGAAVVKAAARHRSVRLTFTTPEDATRQAIWKRDRTNAGRWRLVAYVGPDVHRYRVGSLRHHHRYAFRLRAYRGPIGSTVYSNRVRLRIS
jgi:lysophospholipase L1-like esterase